MTTHNELAYYDQAALWGKPPLDYQREVLADIKTLIPPDVETVLDAGCGDGLLIRLLPQHLHVVGLDFSAAALAHVQAPKVLASLVNIPFPDDSFDLVMANDILEHLPPADFHPAIAELLRVSSRYLIITVPFLENLAAQTTRCPHCSTLYHINHHYRAFALKDVLRMFGSQASAKTILFTGALADPLDETARHLRSSLGILANWDLAVCPSCGSHSPSPDPCDSRSPVARSLASCLPDTPYGTLLPDRNEVAVLYDKAPLALTPQESHSTSLLTGVDASLRRLDARKVSENGSVFLKADAHDLAPASRIYLEIRHDRLALRVAAAPSPRPAHLAVPPWLDFDRLMAISPPSMPPREADPLTLSAISQLIDDRLHAQGALRNVTARKDAAVSLASDLASRLSDSNTSADAIRETVAGLEARLVEAAAANTAQSIRIESLLAQHRASRKELLSLRSEKRLLETDRSSLAASLSRLEDGLASTTAKVASLENDLASAKATIASLENDLLVARLPLHRKAWRTMKARVKRLGKGPWRSRADHRHLLLAQTKPSVFHHEWSPSPPSRRFLMLCHDQSIDRRIVQQAHALFSAGYRGIIVALSFDAADAVDSCDGVPVHRIGLSRLVPDCPVYWRYQNRQNRILWWGRQFRLLSWLNWKLYKLDLALVYRNSRINHPLPFDNAFHAAARLYPADLVVAHDLPALDTARLLASDWKAALVYDSHELYSEQAAFSRTQKRMLDRREKECIPHCDLVLTVSDSLARHMAAKNRSTRPSVVLNAAPTPAPADVSPRLFHDMLSLPDDAVVMLFQGGMLANRNIETLVRGFLKVRNTLLHLVFLGPRDASVEKRVRRIAGASLGKRIHLLDAVSQQRLAAFTASADFGVIPYVPCDLNSKYCMPNKMFEYIQAGLPVLANKLVEVEKILSDIGAGLVADLSSPSSVARAIREMLQRNLDDDRAHVLANRHHFSWETHEKHYLALLETVMAARTTTDSPLAPAPATRAHTTAGDQ